MVIINTILIKLFKRMFATLAPVLAFGSAAERTTVILF
jgi:ammonia channel protein AmtB